MDDHSAAPADSALQAMTYHSEKGPDVALLTDAYRSCLTNLSDYLDRCQDSRDQRLNYWPGKSRDLRKQGADAFPWKGASDTEAHVISERIDALVAVMMTALNRANIRAYPVEMGDTARARVVSSFLKWMIASYIPGFAREMEKGANFLLERGMAVSYIGWERSATRFLQEVELSQIEAASPDLAAIIVDGHDDATIVSLLQSFYPELSAARARKAIVALRRKGVAELPVVKQTVDRPTVSACAPDSDVFFPAFTTDPDKAPYVFWRTYLTPQELENRKVTQDWDAEWVEYAIEHLRGIGQANIDSVRGSAKSSNPVPSSTMADLIEVVHAYQRLVDDDGAEGIYCTVFSPSFTGDEGKKIPGFAKFELLNGYDSYPFVVTRLKNDAVRLYDVQTLPEQMRGLQWQVKVERDSRSDRNSLATVPPIMHPPNRPPANWRPGGMISRNRPGEFEFAPVPQSNPGSIEIEQTMLKVADNMVGMDPENPLSPIRQQFFVTKFLQHVQESIAMAFKAFQRFGPDEVFFRVTGVPDAQKFQKGDPNENFDIRIAFDVMNNDPETVEKKLAQYQQVAAIDRNGRIDIDELVTLMAAAIDPIGADMLLQPIEAAKQKVVKGVTDDLTKIFSGIEVGAPVNGQALALQVVQGYAQQPDVAQRLAGDKAFATRLQKYAEQLQFALVQNQNADIGRLGTAPAAVGNVNTQGAGK